MKTIINELGQVEDLDTAREMAYIEKPFRENPLTLWQNIFKSKHIQILDGEKQAEIFLNTRIKEEEKLLQKQKEDEEKRIKEEQELLQKQKEEEKQRKQKELLEEEKDLFKKYPEDAKKLDLFIQYLDTNPDADSIYILLMKYANEANECRDAKTYLFYKKARRALYEYFVKNGFGAECLGFLLRLPTDWHSLEDDYWLLRNMNKNNKTGIYGNYGYISIYRLGSKIKNDPFNYPFLENLRNKSLAAAIALDYVNYSGYTDMVEEGTGIFLELLLNGYGTNGFDTKYNGLLAYFPIEDFIREERYIMKYDKYRINIRKLKFRLEQEIMLTGNEFQIIKQDIEEEIKKKEEENRIKNEKEKEERKRKKEEKEKREKEELLQKQKEEDERLQKQKNLAEILFEQN